MSSMDATVLLSYIKKISKQYGLDYKEVTEFCGLPVVPRLKAPKPAASLEYITLEGLPYLYDHVTHAVYTETRGKVKYVGDLALDSYKLITRPAV